MFKLSIKTDNAAFHEGDAGQEVARILKEIAKKVESGHTGGNARDGNGNTVGTWSLKS